jgi:hypothetical protein
MLLKVCVMPVIYLDFELRRDYIVKNLCVNKSRPELKCDGKCYLAKRIAAAQEKEERHAEQIFVFQLCETLAEPIKPLFPISSDLADASLDLESGAFCYASRLNDRLFVSGVFHPPLFV